MVMKKKNKTVLFFSTICIMLWPQPYNETDGQILRTQLVNYN